MGEKGPGQPEEPASGAPLIEGRVARLHSEPASGEGRQAAEVDLQILIRQPVVQVGEQADGYLGFVAPQDDPGLTAAVAEINTARARLYAETARRHGVSPEVAGVAAAKALFETKLRPGDYYRDATGVWRRK